MSESFITQILWIGVNCHSQQTIFTNIQQPPDPWSSRIIGLQTLPDLSAGEGSRCDAA